MKTIYGYMEFKLQPRRGKTQVWLIENKGSNNVLAVIKWYGAWRQYCFFPFLDTVFNTSCLSDIQHFIKQLMDERKNK